MLWHTHYTGSTFSPAKTLFVASCVRCTREAQSFPRFSQIGDDDQVWLSVQYEFREDTKPAVTLLLRIWSIDKLFRKHNLFLKRLLCGPRRSNIRNFAKNGYDPLNFEVGTFLLHIWSWMFGTVSVWGQKQTWIRQSLGPNPRLQSGELSTKTHNLWLKKKK